MEGQLLSQKSISKGNFYIPIFSVKRKGKVKSIDKTETLSDCDLKLDNQLDRYTGEREKNPRSGETRPTIPSFLNKFSKNTAPKLKLNSSVGKINKKGRFSPAKPSKLKQKKLLEFWSQQTSKQICKEQQPVSTANTAGKVFNPHRLTRTGETGSLSDQTQLGTNPA